MKKNVLFKAIAVVTGIVCVASITNAATCSSTLGPITSAPYSSTNANNCGNNTNFSGSTAFCSGVQMSSSGTDVYAIQLGAAQNFTFKVDSTVFAPDVALWSGSCADNASCVNGTDYLAPGNTSPWTITTAAFTGNPAGTYYIVITNSAGTGTTCGAYNLTVNTTLPVKLQKFSVN
ncbi:MAG: hypothetical protein JSR27_05505 [Proteobacteria bacterium]|nr:hypothetical protein [Pseudomonadota bacterium]